MAEYIDRKILKKSYYFQTKGGVFPKSELFVKRDDIFNMPTADVVERKKIDKAIEEIESQQKFNIECDGESDLGIAIQIIKKHLGEVEE